MILKFKWKNKGTRIIKINLNKKNKVGGIALLDTKAYCITAVIRAVWFRQKDTQINGTEQGT